MMRYIYIYICSIYIVYTRKREKKDGTTEKIAGWMKRRMWEDKGWCGGFGLSTVGSMCPTMLPQNFWGEMAQSLGRKRKTARHRGTPCFLFCYGDVLAKLRSFQKVRSAFLPSLHFERVCVCQWHTYNKYRNKYETKEAPVHPDLNFFCHPTLDMNLKLRYSILI